MSTTIWILILVWIDSTGEPVYNHQLFVGQAACEERKEHTEATFAALDPDVQRWLHCMPEGKIEQ
jgi:hypothetical protein